MLKNIHQHMNKNGSDISQVDECLCWKIFLIIHIADFKNLHLNMASKTYHINISVTKKVNDFTNLCISKNRLIKLQYLSDI